MEEDFGMYRRIVIARTTDKRILQVCQDGGVVSTLLTVALQNGIINGAVVSGISKEKPFYPIPKLVTTPEEVLECAGTRYSYSPNMLALREGVKNKEAKLAFIGTPCQINVIRKMQMLPLKKYAKALNFTIGLMCTETFNYEGLMEKHIQGVMGIDLQNVKKINIKGKILVATKSNEVKGIPLKVAKQYARKTCDLCTDFSSELADISTGGLGLTGWTLTILRTKKGEEVFEYAQRKGLLETKPVEQEERAVNLLIRLSKSKRRKNL
jgi:coenzyme F420 hydrogenase subunit beta